MDREEKNGSMGAKGSPKLNYRRGVKRGCVSSVVKNGGQNTCKFKHYQLLLVESLEDEEEETELNEEEAELELENKTLQLSLKSKEGLTTNKSFKTWGRIDKRQVLMLVDCGATSNFISRKLVEELNLAVDNTPKYTVEVETREKVRSRGICRDVVLEVQGVEIKQNFFIFDLGGTEVVLGMDWLASLGDIEANFRNLIIKWEVGGSKVALRGEPSLCKAQASWKTLIKALQDEGVGYYIEYQVPTIAGRNKRTATCS
ncbi:Aspartic peptidase domain superfamily [Sesbania bispinosa]|nr:Aspartic peptidase domain superfamily [Sesbania bispinosa]